MTTHPYASMPEFAFWSRSIAQKKADEVDPVVKGRFTITKGNKIATAGSCFAQHIARHLSYSGFNYFVTETANPILEDVSGFNYGTYSARYGNVYTARQLLQLIQRAYAIFQPDEDAWPTKDGKYKDPFRPEIQPGGFSSKLELEADRNQHLAAVRRMIEEMDVFIFTLGLTEAWVSNSDGAVFPVCPGVAGGTFSSSRYSFVNFGLEGVVSDLEGAFSLIREKNPKVRFLVTVSPVPLAATGEARSVLVSTTLSKAVLRLASDMVQSRHQDVAYFPSYEIITGPHARGRYFDDDLRSVTAEGVSHVMKMFMRHYSDAGGVAGAREVTTQEQLQFYNAVRNSAAVICEEAMLDS